MCNWEFKEIFNPQGNRHHFCQQLLPKPSVTATPSQAGMHSTDVLTAIRPDPWLCGVLLTHPNTLQNRSPSIPCLGQMGGSSAAHGGTSPSRRGSLAGSAGQQQVIFLLKSTAQSLNTHSWAQSGWRSHLLNKKWPLLCFVTRFRADSTLKPFGVAL